MNLCCSSSNKDLTPKDFVVEHHNLTVMVFALFALNSS